MRTGLWPALIVVLAALAGCSEPPRPAANAAAAPRLVTLAPNLTELVYAAGAGHTLVGVSAYSDYPPAALEIPVIGDAFSVDHEQLALLKPDLLLAWESGMPAHIVDELRRVGHRVEVVRTRGLYDVAEALRRIGTLAGVEASAKRSADAYLEGLDALAARYAGNASLRVFYQVSERPLYTVNGEHYVSELIELCGGVNVFAGLDELAPAIDVESVLDRDPEVLMTTDAAGPDAFREWQRWPELPANRYGNHFRMPADLIVRATPRLLAAGEQVCQAIVEADRRRAQAGQHGG